MYHQLTLDLPDEVFRPLAEAAQHAGQSLEQWATDQLRSCAASQAEVERLAAAIDWKSAREALRPPQQWFDRDEPKPF